MADYPELGNCLRILADEATQSDIVEKKSLWATSANAGIQDALNHMLHKTLNVEKDLWNMAYQVSQSGNMFEANLVQEGYGVVKLLNLPVATVRRIEDQYGHLWGYVQDQEGNFDNVSTEQFKELLANQQGSSIRNGQVVFEPWEVAHFRYRATARSDLYGVSVVDAARQVWVRLRLMEDAMVLFKLTRAPARYAFYVDVGDINPNQRQAELEKIKNNYKKRKYVNPKTGQVEFRYNVMSADEDFFMSKSKGERLSEVELLSGLDSQGVDDSEYFRQKLFSALPVPKAYLSQEESIGRANLCLVPETKIPLLDGRVLSMEQIIGEHEQGNQNWVYSIDKNSNVAAGKITAAFWTRKNAEIVRVHLDNGAFIDATPDHKFMLRDGSFIEAGLLNEGQSLMPWYRKESTKTTRKEMKTYHSIYDPGMERYVTVHRAVFSSVGGKYGPRTVLHHADFNRYNNNPDNLVLMNNEAHMQLHREHFRRLVLENPEVQKRRAEAVKKWTSTQECADRLRANRHKGDAKRLQFLKSEEHKALKSIQMRAQWKNGCFAHGHSERARDNAKRLKEKYANGELKIRRGSEVGNFRDVKPQELAHACLKNGWGKQDLIRHGYSQCLIDRVLKQNGFASWEEFRSAFSISKKVFTRESTHNFQDVRIDALIALCEEGLILRKEDFFSHGIKLWVLNRVLRESGLTYQEFANKHVPGGFKSCIYGQSRKEVEAREIGVYKNHKVVRIERLLERRDCCDIEVEKHHNFATEAGVFVHNSQQDIRLAKTVLRIQDTLKDGFRQICNTHLAARNIDPDQIEYDLNMVIPSGTLEMIRYEVKRIQVELAQQYSAMNFPEEYVWRDILGFSEDEIVTIRAMRDRESSQGVTPPEGDASAGSGSSSSMAAEPDTPPEPEEAAAAATDAATQATDAGLSQISSRIYSMHNQIVENLHRNQRAQRASLTEIKSLASDIRSRIGKSARR
ncbi:MAG: portal protein [Luteolibacter sp.]